ncbi:hypothetical protein [Zunongwangia sp. H14]|uniref:hypothetical protein n=1 Tax=Zunongwangia sp. H14 TaxID=3240792 RepID=UPI00356AC9DD
MKILDNNKSFSENLKYLGELINPFLEDLLTDRIKYQQKILELCHTGKFLMLLNQDVEILELREQPDFLLNQKNRKIGLEHEVILNQSSKNKEGFFEELFLKAEQEIINENQLPNFLANCYLKPYLSFQTNQKRELIDIIKEVVENYIEKKILIENPIIEEIWEMPHTQISINVNFGFHWQKDLNEEILKSAILKKEDKIEKYKENLDTEHWLLMVIASGNDSSYILNFKDFDYKSKFDRVFLLEDVYNNLYEL